MEYVWTPGRDNADLFPSDVNPGLAATKDAASQILGLPIDYTTVINLEGFTQLVDAMGGVTVDVKERVCIGCKIEGGVVVGTTGYIEPGVRELDGYHALWYSRSRADSGDGDFSRMRRQRCMVGGAAQPGQPDLDARALPGAGPDPPGTMSPSTSRSRTSRLGRSWSSGSRRAAASSRCR
uniref:LCP family protein n=1 Tax=Janibacter limosus TaxID=53458 RepID=A0AC61U3C1_9MICO|nr:LCP family protein [Janibacter limosus]